MATDRSCTHSLPRPLTACRDTRRLDGLSSPSPTVCSQSLLPAYNACPVVSMCFCAAAAFSSNSSDGTRPGFGFQRIELAAMLVEMMPGMTCPHECSEVQTISMV